MKSKIVNTLLFWLILIVIGLNLGFQIYSNKNLYLRPFNLNLLQKTYQYSQYAANPENRKLTIQDYDLFAYSGYQYLKGTTPAELQIEHPPLAKYFFGLSILLFSNPNIIQIFFGVGVLIVVYQIGKRAIENDLLALLPLLIISFDGTFKEQLALSYLDLPHLFFISCAVLFYLMAKNGKKYYFFVSIFLGATVMSKYIGFIIIPLLVGHAFIKRKKDFIFFAKTLAIIPAIYFLNYLPIFLKPNALVVFVNLHIAILHLYRSYLPNYPWGEIWRLLAFGQWRVWFGESEFLKVREWNVFWPLTLVGIFWSIFSFRHFKNEAQIIVFLFAFLYLITNSFHVIFPRHLLTFLPFGYILLILSAKKITERILILNKKVSS